MEINRNNVIEIAKDFGVRPDKDYGQNFLIDPNICLKIVQNFTFFDKATVLEVGPGLGSLTHFFNAAQVNYTGVDIDRRMIDFLKYNYKEDNLKFIQSDIRNYDVSNYDFVCGNLPYNITTELISYLLIKAEKCQKFVLMCQSETLNHFLDVSGKEYGPTSILIHLLGDIRRLFNVKPGAFYPSPKCSSTVFEIVINKEVDRKEAINTYVFSKKMFLNRRKTILNNLVNELKDKEKAIRVLEKCSISITDRPESISPDLFLKLSKEICK